VAFCGTWIEAGGGAGDSTSGLGRVFGIRAPRCFEGSQGELESVGLEAVEDRCEADHSPRFSLIASGGWMG
jgi:hypothetical protein